MRQINLRVPEDWLEQIDQLRGNVPRERYLRAAVRQHMLLYTGDALHDGRAFVQGVERDDREPQRRQLLANLDRARGEKSRGEYVEMLVASALHADYGQDDDPPVAVYEIDSDFRVTGWGEEAERLLGWTADEVLGQRAHELLHTHKDPVQAERLRAVRERGHWRGTVAWRTKAGEPLVARCEALGFRDRDGTFAGFRVVIWPESVTSVTSVTC